MSFICPGFGFQSGNSFLITSTETHSSRINGTGNSVLLVRYIAVSLSPLAISTPIIIGFSGFINPANGVIRILAVLKGENPKYLGEDKQGTDAPVLAETNS